MKLLTYKVQDKKEYLIGILIDSIIYNLNHSFGNIDLIELIQIENYQEKILEKLDNKKHPSHKIEEITFLSPVPKPKSLRDAYAFRQHVENARKNRNAKMIPEFDEFPVFYFSNHNAIFGHNESIELMPDHFEKLDYELEFAIVIGKGGKNILSKNAHKHIGGFCILNDISGRKLQMEEMKLNLGPAKGKDFASVLGPYLITPDELKSKTIDTEFGRKYDLSMKCYVNGTLMSEGNAINMNWTFEEIIERASYGVELFPGDVIGSGTVGTGCLLEINGTKKRKDPEHKETWIKEGDIIEMEIDILGKIKNTIIKSTSNHSILKLKK
tara:strand:+ start:1537 stop:2514 length:978 start_codon:yes stop_codon:yes gene_type:complete